MDVQEWTSPEPNLVEKTRIYACAMQRSPTIGDAHVPVGLRLS
jgi:hypothetical protein